MLKLGIDVGESSVSKYMVRRRKPPSQNWRTFLANFVHQLKQGRKPLELAVTQNFR